MISHLYLPLHGDAEEGDEVHDEDGPEDRDVENLEKGTAEGDCGGLGGRVPELELGQPPDERPKLLALVGRQARRPVWRTRSLLSRVFRRGVKIKNAPVQDTSHGFPELKSNA